MSKYIFDINRLSNLIATGMDAPRETWTRKTAENLDKPTWKLTPAEAELNIKLHKMMLKVWHEAHEAATADPQIAIVRVFWPTNIGEDFAILAQTRAEFNIDRYPTLPGRFGYGASIKGDILRGARLVPASGLEADLRAKVESLIGDAALTPEIRPASFPEGASIISVVYKQPEGQARKPWMDAARWPLHLVAPFDVTTSVLSKERGHVSVIGASDLAEAMYPASFNPNDGSTAIESDIAMLKENLTERVQAARNNYYAEVRARMRANVTETTQVKVRTPEEARKSLEAFGAHRKSHKQKLEESLKGKEAIAMLPFIGHGYASSRRWGIEIESGGARGIEAPAGWKRKGDGSLRSAWHGWVNDGSLGDIMLPSSEEYTDPETCPSGVNHGREYFVAGEGWRQNPNYSPNCTQCGYYTRQGGPAPIGHVFQQQNDDRAEFVSPILRSMHSKGLETVLEKINLQPQNDSAGVHVHVEATDLTPKQLGSLVYGYDRIEGLIESSYRRTKREYCKLRSDQSTMEVLKKVKTAKRLTDVPAGDRYVTLNLNSLSNHGTVEFRAMGNVYDYEYLSRWAMFCREMVNIAKAGVTAKEWNSVASWADVTALFAKYGREYIRAVMDTMGEEVPSSPRLAKDGSVSMPTGDEAPTSEITVNASTFAEMLATMDEGATNSRWITTVEQTIAEITSESSQRFLVGALASGETEV